MSMEQELESVLMGAHVLLEQRRENAQWLVEQLRQIYERYPKRVGTVTVKATGDGSVSVEGEKNVRVLRPEAMYWGISTSVTKSGNVKFPGPVAALLADV